MLKIFVVQGTMSMRTVSVTCAPPDAEPAMITTGSPLGQYGLLESRDRHFAEFVDVLGRET